MGGRLKERPRFFRDVRCVGDVNYGVLEFESEGDVWLNIRRGGDAGGTGTC